MSDLVSSKASDRVSRSSVEHVIYCCGARVRLSENGIQVLSKLLVECRPLHEALYGTKHIDAEAVRKTITAKTSRFGFCYPDRAFNAEPVVGYGAYEMMRFWLEKMLIDCAIVVCDGAGTVITANGGLGKVSVLV